MTSIESAAGPPTRTRARLHEVLHRARTRTALLTDAVSDDELRQQHSPLMSPFVWDLAHIGNQEEMWLIREVGRRAPIRADIDDLYDAFRHARSTRPGLPLLDPTQAREYTAGVRQHALDVLDASSLTGDRLVDGGFAFAMIAQHEQQHDETMLATHQLRTGAAVLHTPDAPRAPRVETDEVVVPAGGFVMGTDADPWALDNERPAHRVHVPAFAIERFPVTNGRWAEFIDDGGYERPELWSNSGWEHRQAQALSAPQFWERSADGSWCRRGFGTIAPIRENAPVVHVCYFEAEAFARWAGKRLPTESEWEKAARFDPSRPDEAGRRYPWGDDDPTSIHANLAQRHLEPADVGAYPDGASPLGVHQMIGDVWEWTSSGFTAYPGFAMFPYPEYSEVFFGGDYRVLRGGSFGTDPVAIRSTFRNWDHPIRRQIFSGVRLARDLH